MKKRVGGKGGLLSEGLEKLQSSGLDEKDAKLLGIYTVPNATSLHKTFENLKALVLPYYGEDKKPLSAQKTWPQFYRIRYLEKSTDFKALNKKPARYTQAPGSGVCAYFPTTVEWAEIFKETSEPILITEGELKAAKACKEGFPTIGVGGVYNFMSSRNGVWFLPELGRIDWRQRKVYIVYDSDYVENFMVCNAINKLTEELDERGAVVHLATLPSLSSEYKTGLDDFLVAKSVTDFQKVLAQAEPLGFSRTLWSMNNEVVYIENPGMVVVQSTAQKMAPNAFSAHSRWSTMAATEAEVNKDGEVVGKKTQASVAWLRWPLRKSCVELTYQPGAERITPENKFNQWPGWGCEPVKGDIKLWTQLCEHLFSATEKEALEWFYDWCAYPLQNPGVKMFSSVVVHGIEHGTGKSLIGYTLGRIYGKNFKEVKSRELQSDFTTWAENKQFVLGDEITGSDKRAESDSLKKLITQRTMTVNAKWLPEYEVPDCINYYFTSNHPDAFFLEDKDRRYMIVEVFSSPLSDEFYRKYDTWLNNSGPSHLFHWLLNRDLKKFNPTAAAFKTAAKDRMIFDGKSDIGVWVRQLIESPEAMLRMGKMRLAKDLYSSKELLALYEAHSGTTGKVTANGLGRELRRAGIPQVYNGMPLAGPDGVQQRYYIIRNREYWIKNGNQARAVLKNLAVTPVRD
jgi:hypothetical protein